jgi:hypothetical protein
MPISKEGYNFWKSLPETRAIQEAVLEQVKYLRVELAKKLDRIEDPKVQASFLNGLEFGYQFDNLFQFGEETDAKDGGTQVVDKAETRRSAVRGQY